MPDLFTFEMIVASCLGVALAAACGFRVFVPMLVVSAAANAQWLTLSDDFAWVGGWPALACFAIATVVEIVAYYVPWLDNLLDTISIPAAVVAGIVVSGSAMIIGDMHPLLAWSLAVIAGGGAAGTVSAGTSAVRATSSLVTGGLGNPVVSTLEWVAALVLSILAVLIPIAAALLVVVLLFFSFRFVYRWWTNEDKDVANKSATA